MCQVRTNNVPRPLVELEDLSRKDQEKAAELDAGQYFFYKEDLYSTGEFLKITSHGGLGFTFHLPPDHPLVVAGWQGISQDGLGMVLKFSQHDDIVVGWATDI